MKILVTGATGYLGSRLVRALLPGGHRVAILTRRGSDRRRIADLLPRLSVHEADRDDPGDPFRREGGLDAVVHAATCYGRAGESAAEILDANTAFPVRLLEASIRAGTETFLNAHTSLPRFLGPYSLTKSHFAEWGRYFGEKGEIGFVNVRMEHVYGPGDDDSKFVTRVVRGFFRHVPEMEFTGGEQRRDFIYIDDVVSAYLLLLETAGTAGRAFREYDLGSGESTPIRDVVETIHRLTGSRTRVAFGALPYRRHEMMDSRADLGPLRSLGWSPRVGFEEGIRKILAAEGIA